MSDESTWWRCVIRGLVLVFTIGVSGVVALGSRADSPLRTWTDSTGRFTIEARMISSEEGQVLLERADGSVVKIDLEKLSGDDQRYVAELSEASPFETVEPSPFRPAEGPTVSPSPTDGDVPAAGREVRIDWSRSKAIDLSPQQDEWSFEPISPPTLAASISPRITVPPKRDFFEKAESLVVSSTGRRAVIGYQLGRPRTEGTTRLVSCDLESGHVGNLPEVPGQLVPLALPPQGNPVLMRRNEFGFGNQDRLEFWAVSAEGISRQVQWTPYDDQRGGARDVKWAAYAADNRLLTINSGGQLALWDPTVPAPIWHVATKGGLTPALHPNGRWLAVIAGEELMMIDIEAGAVAAVRSAPANLHHPTLAFSPDGARLAAGSRDQLYVWEMVDGQLSREILLSGSHVGSHLLWTDAQHLLIGRRVLVNVDHQVRLWEYQGAEQVARLGDTCLLVNSQGAKGPGTLVLASLPHPQVGRALEQAMAEPDFFVLQEGTRVQLDVSGIEDAERRDEVRQQLEQKLESQGFQVDEQGTIRLVASTERGDRRSISYRTIGRGFGVRTYQIREFVSRLVFEYEGQTAWQSRGTNLPGFVRLEEGQTMERYLRRSERPNYGFFERIELPRLLMKPTNGSVLGRSTITAAGIQ